VTVTHQQQVFLNQKIIVFDHVDIAPKSVARMTTKSARDKEKVQTTPLFPLKVRCCVIPIILVGFSVCYMIGVMSSMTMKLLPSMKHTDMMFALSYSRQNLTQASYVEPRVIYSRARKDRSGAVIHDMLLAHAYAFAQDHTTIYGGACVSNRSKWTVPELQTRHSELLQGLGLDRMLPFVDCPAKEEAKTTGSSIVPRQVYRPRLDNMYTEVDLWTPEWLAYVHSKMDISNKNRKEDTFVIAVHIRRGDIVPCSPNFGARYLPNQHYLQLIQAYLPPSSSQKTTKVIIYSESTSTESWEKFLEHNYSLALDTNIADLWRGIIMADVVILSRSSFSFVPAALNVYQYHHGSTIVYTPWRYYPPPHWHVVNSTIMNGSQKVMNRKYDNCSMLSSVQQQRLKNNWRVGDKIPNATLRYQLGG
jgi:hypothetical protein